MATLSNRSGLTPATYRAQLAFKTGDSRSSQELHRMKSLENYHEEQRLYSTAYCKEVVNGLMLGLVITISYLSSLSIAKSRAEEVTLWSIEYILVSVGVCKAMHLYISTTLYEAYREAERQREEWECENYLEGEKEEMVQLYERKGLSKADAHSIVEIISKDKKVFVEFMMIEELGFSNHPDDIVKSHTLNSVFHGLSIVASLALYYLHVSWFPLTSLGVFCSTVTFTSLYVIFRVKGLSPAPFLSLGSLCYAGRVFGVSALAFCLPIVLHHFGISHVIRT